MKLDRNQLLRIAQQALALVPEIEATNTDHHVSVKFDSMAVNLHFYTFDRRGTSEFRVVSIARTEICPLGSSDNDWQSVTRDDAEDLWCRFEWAVLDYIASDDADRADTDRRAKEEGCEEIIPPKKEALA